MSTDFAPFMADVARELRGEENKRLSSKGELRFGSHGSFAVDLEKGTWFDHEANLGGGVLDLIGREVGAKGAAAVDWLRQRGFPVEDPAADFRDHRRGDRDGGERQKLGKVVATYDYVDEFGEPLFQVLRFDPKTFRQRRRARPDDPPEKVKNGWVWSVREGVRLVPYRLPELVEAVASDRVVFVVEGEKDVENLRDLGIPATCNPMGTGKWLKGYNEYLAGADVVIIEDNDPQAVDKATGEPRFHPDGRPVLPGQDHARDVASQLAGIAKRVRILSIPGLPLKGDVSDWIKAGGDAGGLYDLVETVARDWGASDATLNFETVWFADTDTMLPEAEYLVDRMLTRGDFSEIYGKSQSGKSFLATHIGLKVAQAALQPDVRIFGKRIMSPGGVIYVAAEGQKGFRKRIQAWRQWFGVEARAPLPFALVPVAVDMFAEEGDYPRLLADIDMLRKQMRQKGHRLELVVFDTHAAVSPGADENASQDAGRMIKHYKAVQQVSGAHVLVVHHKNAAGTGPRGHTSIYGALDNAIEVTKEDDGARTATIAKLKDDEDGLKLDFRLKRIVLGVRDDHEEISSCVIDEGGTSSGQSSSAGEGGRTFKREKMTKPVKLAYRALVESILELGEPAPSILRLGNGVRVVKDTYFRATYKQLAFDSDVKDSTFKSAVKRSLEELQTRNIIGRQAPYLWIVRDPEAT